MALSISCGIWFRCQACAFILGAVHFVLTGFLKEEKIRKMNDVKKYEKFLDGIETRTMKKRMASWH